MPNVFLCISSQFKYLGHIIYDNLTDDEDIQRELKISLFVLMFYLGSSVSAL